MFKVGDVVRVVADYTGHVFEIGDVVVLTDTAFTEHLGRRWKGNDRGCGWLSAKCIAMAEEEIDLLELL